MEYDQLFMELSQQMSPTPLQLQESSEREDSHSSVSSNSTPQPGVKPTSVNTKSRGKSNMKQRPFAAAKSDREIELARASGISHSTQKDTKYCIGLWEAWVAHRAQATGDIIKPIGEISKEELNYWLTRFILEVTSYLTFS